MIGYFLWIVGFLVVAIIVALALHAASELSDHGSYGAAVVVFVAVVVLMAATAAFALHRADVKRQQSHHELCRGWARAYPDVDIPGCP